MVVDIDIVDDVEDDAVLQDDFEHEMKRFGVSFVCTWFPFKATFRLVKIKCENMHLGSVLL